MSSSVIGALRVVLGADTAAFSDGMDKAQRELNRFGKEMARTGAKLTSAGQALTLGLTVPIIGIGVASVRAAQESADALAQVQASLTSMGAVSGKTLADLEAQAESLMNASLFDDDDILRSVTANLLTFGKVSGQTFDRAQVAVVDLATKMRMDLQSATILVGKALNDPIKGLTALGRSGVQFTASQKELIKSLVATGQTAKAQSIILAELEKQFGGSAKAAQDANPYNKMQDSLNTLSETIGKKLIPTFQPLVEKLNAVLVKFTELSPAVQNNIFLWGVAAAAIGPVLIGLGSMASSIKVLLPLLAGAASANGALGLAIGGLLSPIGLVVAAVAALTVGTVYLVQSQSDAAIAARANKQAHERLDPILNTVSQSLALASASAGDAQKAYLAAARAAFLLGEKEIESARKSVAAARARVEASRQTDAALMRSGVGGMPGYATGMQEQRAKEAEAALKAAEDKLIGAGVARRRGSRGQGTTFVLLDPVEAWKEEQAATSLARSAGNLGDEVEKTGGKARKASEDTRDWADELVNLREQLASPIQREVNATTDQIAFLTEGLEKGKLTAYEVAQALRMINEKLERDRFADTIVKIDQNPTLDGPKLPETGKVMSKETAEGLKAEMTDTFRGALDALRYGGAKGVFEFLADHFTNRMLDNLASQLTNLLDQIMGQMGGGGSGGGGWIATIASIFTGGSGSTPGFATGGSFTVGGSGAMDSKLVQFRATPGEMVNITKGERGQRQTGTNVFDMRGAVVTQDLLNQMNQIAAQGDAQVLGAVAREKTRQDKARRYTVAVARR